MTMTAVLLVLLGVFSRLAPHPPNATILGAVALYAGARLPRRWAWLVPMAALIASDFLLDDWYGYGPGFATRVAIYGTFALLVALGRLPRQDAGPMVRGGLALGGSTLFYLTTNFAVWAAGHGGLYPATAEGLVACYVAALPFYGNMVLADLAGTAVLFGLDALARRATVAREAAPAQVG